MDIECNFLYTCGFSYICKVNSTSITKRNQDIKAFIGKHEAGKSDLDVESLLFDDTEVHYMPRGLNKIFPNLNLIQILNCGLKEITREGLIGLEDISILHLYFNELTTLPDNLFEGMTKLKVINFSNNNIEFISSKLFLPILENQMTYVSFWNNPTINVALSASLENPFAFHVGLPELMTLIDENCKKPPKVENQFEPSTLDKPYEKFKDKFMKELKNLWGSNKFTDFTIIVGDKKINVHKTILAMQSELFAEIFKNEGENSAAELKIEDLSAEVVEEVLRWMYTGQTPHVKNALEIFALAMKLKISGLKEIAENLVSLKLDQTNSMEVFELGHRYGSEQLKDLAFEEIKKFLGQQNLSENLKNEPEKLNELVVAKENFEKMVETLNRI